MPIFDVMHRMNLGPLGIEKGLERLLHRGRDDDVVLPIKETDVPQRREVRQHHPTGRLRVAGGVSEDSACWHGHNRLVGDCPGHGIRPGARPPHDVRNYLP